MVAAVIFVITIIITIVVVVVVAVVSSDRIRKKFAAREHGKVKKKNKYKKITIAERRPHTISRLPRSRHAHPQNKTQTRQKTKEKGTKKEIKVRRRLEPSALWVPCTPFTEFYRVLPSFTDFP